MSNSEICFANADDCARMGHHVGAFRWFRYALIWVEVEEMIGRG